MEIDEQQEKALRAKTKELTAKIVNHYLAIEKIRREDRDFWKQYSKKLEELEELKSERVKKRKYRRKTVNTIKQLSEQPPVALGTTESAEGMKTVDTQTSEERM